MKQPGHLLSRSAFVLHVHGSSQTNGKRAQKESKGSSRESALERCFWILRSQSSSFASLTSSNRVQSFLWSSCQRGHFRAFNALILIRGSSCGPEAARLLFTLGRRRRLSAEADGSMLETLRQREDQGQGGRGLRMLPNWKPVCQICCRSRRRQSCCQWLDAEDTPGDRRLETEEMLGDGGDVWRRLETEETFGGRGDI